MIARYLSGKATPDEEAAVLDYMSENNERLEELLAMTAAVEQFGKEKPERHVRLLWPSLSIAASVVLVFFLGFRFLHNATPSGSSLSVDHSPSYAASDTMMDTITNDRLVEIEVER